MATLVSILSISFGLGIVIMVHELGHLLSAKKVGVTVEKFSIGFGPKLIGKKIGETVYQLSLIPFGGFVKLKGEEDEETIKDNTRLNCRSKKERLLIFAAGSILNILLGFIFLTIVFNIGEQSFQYFYDTRIGKVEGIYTKADILPFDKIIAINNKKVDSWEEIITQIMQANKKVSFELLRDNQKIVREINFPSKEEKKIEISPFILAELGNILIGSPADKAGLQKGDVVIKVNDKNIIQWYDLVEIIQNNPEKKIIFEVKRGENIIKTSLIPEKKIRNNKQVGIIGIEPKTVIKKYSFLEAIKKGINETIECIKMTYIMLWRLITHKDSVKQVSGPIGIIHFLYICKTNFTDLLKLLALISLNLGVINLLPFPILDGGHIMFLGLEAIMHKPLKKETKMVIQQLAIIILLVFIFFVSYNDVTRIFKK